MRASFGEGAAVAILLPIVLLLLGVLSLPHTASAILALLGAWFVVFALVLSLPRERANYIVWGVLFAAFSTFSIMPLQYTAALVILAVILMIITNISLRKKS